MSTNLGKVRYNFKGQWVSTTAYLVNDIVNYKQRVYRCITANTNLVPLSYIGSYWELSLGTFEDQGTYTNATQYYVGDIVTVDNSPYVNAGVGGYSGSPRQYVSTTTDGAYLSNPINVYICIANSLGNAPANPSSGGTAYWQPMSMSGQYGRNNKAYAWHSNRGYVPAGIYPNSANQGWPPNGARPGDSYEDGGLGHAKDGQICFHASFITRNGGIIKWGRSDSGSQGNGQNNYQMSLSELNFAFNEWYDNTLPTPDGLAPKAVQYEEGYQNNLVLFNNGEVYAWGYNGHGQGGFNSTSANQYPMRVGNNNNTTILRGVKAVRIASTHVGGGTNTACSHYILTSSGTIYSWGYNGYGQLGTGNTTNYYVPTLISTGGLNGTPTDIWACGQDYGHLYVLTTTGYMYACGYNGYGELGVTGTSNQSLLTYVNRTWGTGTGKIKKFIIADRQSASWCAVLDASGSIWTWGWNGYGQLGFDNTTNLSSPTQITFPFSTGWTNIWAASGNYPNLWATNSNAANTTWTGYSASTNALYSCGYNGYYNLGRLVTVNSNLTHANNGASGSGVQYDTYRLQQVNVEQQSGTSPYYQIVTNVYNVTNWGNGDNSHQGTLIETTAGVKYYLGYNGYGHAAFGHTDSYLARTRDSIGNVANNLGKRLRYTPPGLNEQDFFIVTPVGWSNYFAALWADKYGYVYFSGGGSTAGWSSSMVDVTNQTTWLGTFGKIPES
jgi:alpha-tubulin suppressor-like RCC1 family protein